MAYDRYDDRDNRGYRDDRLRDDRSGGRQDERGFFDRAIDSVSNFFNDDESGSRGDRGHGYNRAANSYNRSSYEPRAYDQEDRGRSSRDDNRFGTGERGALFGGGQSSTYGRGRDEGDYRKQYGRGGGESGGFGRGDYGSQGQSWQSRQGQDYGDIGSSRSYPSSYGQAGGTTSRDSQQSSWNDRGASQDRQGGGYQSQGSDRYRPMTGDYGRSSNELDRQGSGLGSQNYSQQQYGSQDRFQDQGTSFGGSSGFGDSSRSSAFGSQTRSPHDQHYSSWRQRQIEDLDRDYDEYCREHQSRFENEFSGFRQTRQTKRQMLTSIREHAEVVDESGQRIGTVDKVRGDKVILTKNDPEAHGVHRSFTCSLLDRVEDGKVFLTGTKDSIRSRLTEEREDDQGRSQDRGMLGGLFGGSGSDRDDRQTQPSTNQPTAQTMSPTSTTGATTTGTTSDGPHMLDKSFSGTYDDDTSTTGRSTKK
ncbi:hypothetical protein GGQ97_001614 [Sphingomonas kaistensis]|uniref:DUF2171 domain-containing protein n=1 Tax=Sphingomonas kaistensis TaxID=298708 RepID=A0A7X5Y651_9SPHN|nr:DUF2171 domain-containing protein [Sphingomonas kaistensis]NJC05821.1 hypothetical protein [Sphingomonas kaistensis]